MSHLTLFNCPKIKNIDKKIDIPIIIIKVSWFFSVAINTDFKITTTIKRLLFRYNIFNEAIMRKITVLEYMIYKYMTYFFSD